MAERGGGGPGGAHIRTPPTGTPMRLLQRSFNSTPARDRASPGRGADLSKPRAAARSARREVRNPILALPAARRVAALPDPARALLAALLRDLADDAAQRAQDCWRRHKAPMAAYWKACSVYARHLARVVRPARPAPGGRLEASHVAR